MTSLSTLSFGIWVGSLHTDSDRIPSDVEAEALMTAPAGVPPKEEAALEFEGLPEIEDFYSTQAYSESEAENFVDLFETEGLYRESEVVAKSGQWWLTLFVRNGVFELDYATARVRKLGTVSYPGDEIDVRLSFNRPGKPVFSLKNIKGLTEGKVETAYHRPSQDEIHNRNLPIGSIEQGYDRWFEIGESYYRLRTSTGYTKTGKEVGVLVLEHNGSKQILRQVWVEDNHFIVGTLYWAGDLDRDGKLDLYLDEFNEKGYFHPILYLSSKASEGHLVGYGASFHTAGC